MGWWVARTASAGGQDEGLAGGGAPRKRAEWKAEVREAIGDERKEGSGEETEAPLRRRRRESRAACRLRDKELRETGGNAVGGCWKEMEGSEVEGLEEINDVFPRVRRRE